VFSSPAVYDVLDTLVAEERIAADGVSAETGEQALTAMARPGTASVQIILNAFRLKPLDQVLPAAEAAGVGIIARVPLASGLLSGRYGPDTAFGADDHGSYNRYGEAFYVGRPSAGSTTRPAWRPRASSPRWYPTGTRRPRPPCAGSSSSPA